MIPPFYFIRVDKSLVVPATSIFGESDDGETVYITVPGFTNSFPVTGEIAEAVKAFLTGSRQFPVTSNGVLDVYAGWVSGIAAVRALDGDTPIEWPINLPAGTSDIAPPPTIHPPQVHNSPVPVVDIEKVTRAIKERR